MTKLGKAFTKFSGREVIASEKTRDYKIGNDVYPITEVTIDPADPAVAELTAAAAKAGLALRIWTEGSFGTMDYRLDRLNVDVKKDGTGTFRMTNLRLG